MKSILSKKEPEKRLLTRLKTRAGRGRFGKITTRHRGGGVKRLYRQVSFGEEYLNVPAKVIALEYDPYRPAYLALLEYENGKRVYQLAVHELKVGDVVIAAEKAKIQNGNRMRLENIPLGTMVCNIELDPGQGGKIVRSAGASSEMIAQEGKYTQLKMPSKEIRKVLSRCFATIGRISHFEHRFEKKRKAGQTRWEGRRPYVRGKVMSPRAHPHGGGEGKSPIGMPGPKTPWGKPARGEKTRRRKLTNKYIVKRRK